MENTEIISFLQNVNRDNYVKKAISLEFDAATDIIDSLSSVPFLGTIIKLGKVGLQYNDYLFIKKLGAFLSATSNISDMELEDFFSHLTLKKKEIIADFLVNTMSNLDQTEKAEIIGYVYKHRIKKEYDDEMMIRLSAIVNKSFLSDLYELSNYRTSQTTNDYIADNLFSIGLLADCGIDGGTAEANSGGTIYKLNKVGEVLFNVLDSEEWFKTKDH